MIYLAKAGETLLFAWFAKNEAFLGGFQSIALYFLTAILYYGINIYKGGGIWP